MPSLERGCMKNASVKREAVGNQDSGTNRAGIGRWLARLAVICLPPKCRFRGSRFARQECGTQARDRKHQDWDHPSRRGASINDREKGRGLWMRSGDRCAVEFVAGKERTIILARWLDHDASPIDDTSLVLPQLQYITARRAPACFPDARPLVGFPPSPDTPPQNLLARTTTCSLCRRPRMFPCTCRRRVMQRTARSGSSGQAGCALRNVPTPRRVAVTPPRFVLSLAARLAANHR
ncbi:hypothetical protein F5882DRAFT_386565 [Hyaloscypha sp. PMI_1271]|nr:hypothetical protein F5882DRAFT_386565 [Hyaloscypha sp. PMI_1271]